MKIFGKSSCALALGLGIAFAGAGAIAQDAQQQPPPAAAPAPENQLEKIQVTGSLIPRTDLETPAPVQIITAEDIRRTGQTTISEVLRDIPSNGQGTLSQSFAQAFAGGASGIALRGLNLGSTLVLIDGKRMAPYPLSDDGQRSFVDISSIPLDAIDRVDVLKDGASATYGSDAVAGVVNIILKKEFKGLKLNAEQGLSGRGDGATTHLSATAGTGDLGADGYNVFGTVEFRHQADILVSQRSGQWTTQDFTPYGGTNGTPGQNSVPGVFPSFTFGNGNYPFTTNGVILNPNGSGDYAMLPGNPNCPATGNIAAGQISAAYAAGTCKFQWAGSEIQPDTRNVNALLRFTKALSGGWKNSIEASDFVSRAEQVGPGYADSSAFGTSFNSNPIVLINFGPGHLVPSINTLPATTVPAGYPGNIYNAPASVDMVYTGLGLNVTTYETHTYRVVDDVTGTIATWDLTGSVGYTKASTKQTVSGAVQPNLLQAALNSGFVLNSSTNGTALFAPDMTSTSTDELDFVKVEATHELVNLPGGPMGLALGSEYDHRNLNAVAPGNVANGITPGNDAFAIGQQNVAAAYAELDLPFLKSLYGQLSARYDHYDTYGSSTNPQAELKFTPVQQFSLRGTWGKGFRAPNPAEAGQGGQAYLAALGVDPVLCPHPGTTANPTPNAAGNFPSQCANQFTGINAANSKLLPEKSTNTTLGVILEPIKGYSATIDWWDIKVKNQIQGAGFLGTIPSAASLISTTIVRGPSIPLDYCVTAGSCSTQAQTGSIYGVGPIAFISTPFINATETETSGLDYDFVATMTMPDASKLKAEFQATHVIKYNITVGGFTFYEAGTHGPSYFSGDTGQPRNRADIVLSWDKGPLELVARMNYVGPMSITDPVFAAPSEDQCLGAATANATSQYGIRFFGAPPSNFCKVASFTDFDVEANYNIDKQWSVHGSILNLTDRPPPVDIVTYGGGGGLPYNAAMHQAGAVGRYFTVGATYQF